MTQSVAEWLQQLELGRYAEAFEENAMDWDVLSELTDADLRELGVTALGHRKKLLKTISAFSGGEPTREKMLLSRVRPLER